LVYEVQADRDLRRSSPQQRHGKKTKNVKERRHSSFWTSSRCRSSLYLQPCFVWLRQWDQGRIKGEAQSGEMGKLHCSKIKSHDLGKDAVFHRSFEVTVL